MQAKPCWWEAGRSSLASSSQAAILPPCLEKSRSVCHRLGLSDETLRCVEVLQSFCKMTYTGARNYLLITCSNEYKILNPVKGGLLEQVGSAFLATHLHGPASGLVCFPPYLPCLCTAWQGEAEELECQELGTASPWPGGCCTPAMTALPAKSSQEKRIKSREAISISCCWDQEGVRRAVLKETRSQQCILTPDPEAVLSSSHQHKPGGYFRPP